MRGEVELSDQQSRKVNAALRAVLEQSGGADPVAAVLILRAPAVTLPDALDPADFPDRTAYREAVIARERQLSRELLGPVIDSLAKFGLHPRGGDLHAVAVNGPVRQLLAALDLPEVSHALADEVLELPHPKRGKRDAS
jgi:hypothetical protein